MPYNYLIDDEVRERTKISLKNAIIIIDEAHNIAGFSEETASFDVNTKFLTSCIEELKQLKSRCLVTEQKIGISDEYYIPKNKKQEYNEQQKKKRLQNLNKNS